MGNTSITRKLRTGGIASAIFAIGAGIGWQVADLLFREEQQPLPIVASIQFDGPRPHEAVRAVAPVPSVEVLPLQIDAVAKQAEEERRIADALRRADAFLEQQAAATWEAVARHQQQMQQELAQAQRRNPQHVIRLADAGAARPKISDSGYGNITLARQVEAKPESRSGATGRRISDKSRRGADRTRASRTRAIECPLQWLFAGAVAGRRAG